MQMGVGLMVTEMFYNGLVISRQAKGTPFRLAPDMWVHHVASLGGAVFCTIADNSLTRAGAARRFALQGCRLAATECTTGLPVAFKQALRGKRLKGPRAIVLGVSIA